MKIWQKTTQTVPATTATTTEVFFYEDGHATPVCDDLATAVGGYPSIFMRGKGKYVAKRDVPRPDREKREDRTHVETALALAIASSRH